MDYQQRQIPLLLQEDQYTLAGFPVLGLPSAARSVKYFSLNPFLPNQQNRCPLECAYCVCHQDSSWHHHPDRFAQTDVPDHLLEQVLDIVFATPQGRQGFPLSLCDFSDPFIPAHRERVLDILNQLIDRNAHNLVYITTKVHPGMGFLRQLQATLARPNALRPTVFVSLPPLQAGYERVSIKGRVRLLQDLVNLGIPCCWYLRPLTEEWYDETLLRDLARTLLPSVSHHVVLSGIVMSAEVEQMLAERALVVPEWDHTKPGSKQYLRPAFEQHVRGVLADVAAELGISLGPVMGHRLCGTNGNHAYGCLLCARQDRYCQLFQRRYGATVDQVDSGKLQTVLHEQKLGMQARLPSESECRS